MILELIPISSLIFGKRYPYTLIGMSQLAQTYNIQGHVSEVEKLLLQVVEIRKNSPYRRASRYAVEYGESS
jgi:hypothetical protein